MSQVLQVVSPALHLLTHHLGFFFSFPFGLRLFSSCLRSLTLCLLLIGLMPLGNLPGID